MTETARNPEERLVCIQDTLKSRDKILKKTKPKIPRKKLYPDFEMKKMSMVMCIAGVDEPLLFLDRDKAFEEADKVSKETIFASEEARKGGGEGNMEIEKKEGWLPPPCRPRIGLEDYSIGERTKCLNCLSFGFHFLNFKKNLAVTLIVIYVVQIHPRHYILFFEKQNKE